MPSFDTVSEVDKHELRNAIDNANRTLTTRFDFKGVDASFKLDDGKVVMMADADFQLVQMLEMLKKSMHDRKIDTKCLDVTEEEGLGKQVKQVVNVKQGLDQPTTKKMVKLIKESKIKVQAAIQGEKVRVTGKKRDELQAVMKLLRESEELELPLQFNNFRD